MKPQKDVVAILKCGNCGHRFAAVVPSIVTCPRCGTSNLCKPPDTYHASIPTKR